jgi:hypothetical protein
MKYNVLRSIIRSALPLHSCVSVVTPLPVCQTAAVSMSAAAPAPATAKPTPSIVTEWLRLHLSEDVDVVGPLLSGAGLHSLDDLRRLSKADLVELRIGVGPRNRLMAAIAAQLDGAPPPVSIARHGAASAASVTATASAAASSSSASAAADAKKSDKSAVGAPSWRYACAPVSSFPRVDSHD